MKMSDLILAVGDDNVKFQNLMNDAQNVSLSKGATRISFLTDAVTPGDFMPGVKGGNMGLVIWLPRDKVEAAIAAEKSAKSA